MNSQLIGGKGKIGGKGVIGYGAKYEPNSISGKSVQLSSNNYFSIANNIFSPIQSTFTVEAWIYPTSFANASSYVPSPRAASAFIGDMSTTSQTNYWSFGPTTNNQLAFYIWNGSFTNSTSNTINLNAWNHIAVTSNGSLINFFINGQKDSVSMSNGGLSGSTGSITIGKYNNSLVYSGSFTNIRISNIARYTSNFTPPTSPFTSDANTLFLMQYNGTNFVDNSPNNYTITSTGSPTVNSLTPYQTTITSTASIVVSNIVDSRDGNTYTNYIFTASGSINLVGLPTNKKVYLLAVGGGGGGGGGTGGGGGAGGLVQTQLYPSSTETIMVNIGLGGAMSANGNNTTVVSSSSNINVIAYGGGAGGLYTATPTGPIYGSTGGNGRDGTGSAPNLNVLAVTQSPSQNIGNGNTLAPTYQGNTGGASLVAGWGGGGGGGGAGSVGANGSRGIILAQEYEIDGSGGIGAKYNLYGMASPYNDYYWAGGGGSNVSSTSTNQGTGGIGGGGGGGGYNGSNPTTGGLGGGTAINPGGAGTVSSSGNGGANTGGGGGGGAYQSLTGGTGGSGIVILMVQQ